MVPAGQNAVVFPQQAPALSDTAPLFISSTATNGSGSTTQTTAASSPTDSSPIASTSQTNDSLAQSLPAQTMLSPAEYTKLEAHLLGGDTADGFSYVALGVDGINGISFTQQQLDSLGLSYTAAVNQYVGLFTENAQTIGNLTWGSYTDSSGYFPEKYYAFWGTPATNLPTVGTLSYSLSSPALAQNSSTDSTINLGTLNTLDLTIALNGSSTTLGVAMSFSGGSAGTFNINRSGLSGNWGANGPATFKTSFNDSADGHNYCGSGCNIDIAGFLTGPGGSKAATVYTIQGNDAVEHGSAILDKTP